MRTRMKGRIIVLFLKKERKFFIGTGAIPIAKEVNKIFQKTVKEKEKDFIHYITLTRSAQKAEDSPDGIYENSHYFLFCTNQLIRGKTRGGNFSYRR